MSSKVIRWHPTLPVFQLAAGNRSILYASGSLTLASPTQAAALYEAWRTGRQPAAASVRRLAMILEDSARQTVTAWQQRINAPFAPECLTVYPSNRCNLACRYCYAENPTRSPHAPVVQEATVYHAALQVARTCAARGKPFYLVLHGGGEPTLHGPLIEQLVALTHRIAATSGVSWFGYLATNGVMAESQARWLAEHFDLIGLSCDGPPDIQDNQRPLAQGKPSSMWVARTARALRAGGGRFAIRATITPATMSRQTEIVEYLHHELGADQIRFEPVYGIPNKAGAGFNPEHASPFVAHFLAAQHRARALNVALQLAGVRLDELHGPHCNVLKNVLQITPDGTAVACFLGADGQHPEQQTLVVGSWNETAAAWMLDETRIAVLRRKAGSIPAHCHDCMSAYHCARECPERCYLTMNGEQDADGPVDSGEPGFRCLVQRDLAEQWIFQAAESLLASTGAAGHDERALSSGDEVTLLSALLQEAAGAVDVPAILEQRRSLPPEWAIARASLPLPVWARRGFEHQGDAAWRYLSEQLPREGNRTPMSIYIHAPFCDRRCGFCNSFARPLKSQHHQLEDRFARTLRREIAFWSAMEPLRQRPVTTIHFGGGTPNYLNPSVFASIIESCRTHFSVTPATEWALESTSSLLTDSHLTQLWEWGFRRLHVGVQTLEDSVRYLIGRREPAAVVVEKLHHAMDRGFVVSADIMYGLPRQTLPGFLDTLRRLTAVGIHGLSVYGLHITDLNRKFLLRCDGAQPNPPRDYAYFQVADQYLRQQSYCKTHFTHFALPQDTNLYYAFPQRGEDLLAMGPTADGVFGDYHYRHPDLSKYLAGAERDIPVLEGGVQASPLEQRAHPAVTELMASALREDTLSRLGAGSLLEPWLTTRLLEREREGLALTANGSWFVTVMIKQLATELAAHLLS